MTFIDVAAIAGALAWIPPIFALIRRHFGKSEVEIFGASTVEIGHTTFGPIINLRIAFTGSKKDAIIDSVKIRLLHESGEMIEFEWQRIVKRMFQVSNPEVGSMNYENEQHVLVMKINTLEVEEKFIWFQIPEFGREKKQLEDSFAKKMSYCRERHDTVETVLITDEFMDLVNHAKQAFVWKPGTYRIEFFIEATEPIDQISRDYRFTLTKQDIERLKQNIEAIGMEYSDRVQQGTPGYEEKAITWNWVYPTLSA